MPDAGRGCRVNRLPGATPAPAELVPVFEVARPLPEHDLWKYEVLTYFHGEGILAMRREGGVFTEQRWLAVPSADDFLMAIGKDLTFRGFMHSIRKLVADHMPAAAAPTPVRRRLELVR